MKILIITEVASPHAARWVNQLKDTGWEVHVFQAMEFVDRVCNDFKYGIIHIPRRVPSPEGIEVHITLPEDQTIFARLTYWNNNKFPHLIKSLHERYLRLLIENIKPDIIHSLGLNINWNNLCMPVLRVLKESSARPIPPWLYSTWGTDLDYYSKMSEKNYNEVSSVLENCDLLITECQRDLRLAQEMGFKGKFIGYFTGFGGVSTDVITISAKDNSPVVNRKTILLKGRDILAGDPIGRAMTAMKAFRLCQDLLIDYRIVIMGATASKVIIDEAFLLSATTNLNIIILPFLSYEQILEIYGSSRVYISLTINDGIPSSLLEAMTLGAFPIHSDLEPIRELITDGKNGLLVPPEDAAAVASALRKALTDNSLVEQGTAINRTLIESRFREDVVQRNVIDMYTNAGEYGYQKKQFTYHHEGMPSIFLTIFNYINQFDGANDLLLLNCIDKILGYNDPRMMLVADKLLEYNNPRMILIVETAIKIKKTQVWDIIEYAIKINNQKIWEMIRIKFFYHPIFLMALLLVIKIFYKIKKKYEKRFE